MISPLPIARTNGTTGQIISQMNFGFGVFARTHQTIINATSSRAGKPNQFQVDAIFDWLNL